MGKKIDLSGKVFGRLTVIPFSSKTIKKTVYWNCLCLCGNYKYIPSLCIRNGDSASCGCLFLEVAANKGRSKRKHGMSGTSTHNIWMGMRARCNNLNSTKFNLYGGRGIKVCDRWSKFENFLADMGACPEGFSIERKDVDLGYFPENCIWANQKTQQNNRRNNTRIDFDGFSLTISQWSDKTGLSQDCISQRIKAGWTVKSALTGKPRARRIVENIR